MQDKPRGHWLILVLLAFAQFMVVLDVSIVNVMLPAVQRAFHLSDTNLQWVITAYTLAFGGFLLLGGRVADLYGRRRVFLSGVVVFALASLADGLSQSGGQLIGLRLLQGLAAAFMSPAALSIVLVTYREGHERNLALSVWGAVASGGAAVGVLLGGIITQYFGWRWNFFINVPIGIFVIIGALRLVPAHAAEERRSDLDLMGAISVTAGMVALVYGLVRAPTDGWTAHSTLITFGASALLLLAFVINERAVPNPLVPFSIFRISNVTGANLVQLANAAALFSVFFFCSLYIQEILGYSPVKTGFSFLVIPAIIAVAATNAPRLINRFGYKAVLMGAPLFLVIGLVWLAKVPVHGHYAHDLLPGFIPMAIGLGLTFVSVAIAATSGVPGHLSGLASGLLNTSQQIGGSLGLAVLSGIAASSTTRFLQNLGHQPTQADIAAASVHGFQRGFYVAAGFAVLTFLFAAIFIKQPKRSPAIEESEVPAAPAV